MTDPDANLDTDTLASNTVASDTAADRFRRLADRFATIVAAVPSDRWDAPSPCPDWTVAQVVDHVAATERELLGRMPFGPDGADESADWDAVRTDVQAALDDPESAGYTYDGYFGPTTFAETVDTFYALDLVVHGWDIARGAGLVHLEALDPADIAHCHAQLEPVGDTVRGPAVFGPAVAVPDDASAQDRFLGWTGRTP